MPVDQITKRFTYAYSDGSLPDGFPLGLRNDFPGVLSRSLEEEAAPSETTVTRYALEDRHIDMEMPFGGTLLTLNIFDDGPMSAKGSHTAPGTNGSMDTLPYLEDAVSAAIRRSDDPAGAALAWEAIREYTCP